MEGSHSIPIVTSLEVRRLDKRDVGTVMELNAAHNEVMRRAKPPGYDAGFRATLEERYLAGKDQCAMFGAFREDRLDACVSVYLWSTFPYYSTGNLKVRPGTTNLFSCAPTPLGLCVQAVLRFTEARGRLRGYMVRSANHWPVDRVVRALERTVPELRRYHREIEVLVASGTRPEFPFVWQLMGQRVWDRDIVVEAVTLSQAGRAQS